MTINKDILKELGEELNLTKEEVELIYKNYWKYIRATISDLDIKDNEFTNSFSINIPSIGKFYTNKEHIKQVKKKYKYINRLINENKKG